ncbi:MAG: dihydrofolate reductase [Zetaproteobacteria bacterium]|nr:MAG: dihydrofolate reductase [Zetaproteobacteria bacterium]
MLALVWAEDENGAIGHEGRLPWGRPIPADMAWFRAHTVGHTVIMGRRTWESLGEKPLPKRTNIVVSTTLRQAPGARIARSLEEAIAAAEGHAFVIGGAKLFAAALPIAERAFVSVICAAFPADTWFPDRAWRQHAHIIKEKLMPPSEGTPWPIRFLELKPIREAAP